MSVDPAQVPPEYVIARTTVATPLEVDEARLFTASAVWSELDVRATTLLPAMYPTKFSRDEYWFDADIIARLTRGKK